LQSSDQPYGKGLPELAHDHQPPRLGAIGNGSQHRAEQRGSEVTGKKQEGNVAGAVGLFGDVEDQRDEPKRVTEERDNAGRFQRRLNGRLHLMSPSNETGAYLSHWGLSSPRAPTTRRNHSNL
jgi:hypothetical protein